MIKRNESKPSSASRKREARKHVDRKKVASAKKRRLTMEGLETRQLLAVLVDPPTQPAPTSLPIYDTARNVGSVAAFNVAETESSDNPASNNFRSTAQFLPLGTGAGQEDTIDLTGTLPLTTSSTTTVGSTVDIDTYAFDLRGGDILDVATLGAAGDFAIQGPYGANGFALPGQPAVAVSFASSVAVGGLNSPLQDSGNVTGTFVAPADGRYYLVIGTSSTLTTYTAGLRVYRPVTESLAFGDAQILYLDWEGGIIENNLFRVPADPLLPNFGFTIIPSIEESLNLLGIQTADVGLANQLASEVYSEVVDIFEELAINSGNGDFEQTGIPSDYGIRILSSRDPIDRLWYEANANDPRITRALIGGGLVNNGLDDVDTLLGRAEFVDVGNFDLSQLTIYALDNFAAAVGAIQLSPGSSQVDALSRYLAAVVAHEAAHTFGMIHTDPFNATDSLADSAAGGYFFGVGDDGIFGTLDDELPTFVNDFFADPTIRVGYNRIRENLAHVLSTGTVGGTGLNGSVFNDANGNGARSGSESGLSGVTVFADVNGNGQLEPSEPQTVTGVSGVFSLTLPPGGSNILAIAPPDFVATTAPSVSSSSGSISFGFRQTVANITGTTYVDTDGDGVRDTGEGGLSDVFIYLDLDGDNRPDIGEPNTLSDFNGTYSLNFPGPGTYTIRQAIPEGFEQTFPASGEHIVTFDGSSVGGNFDFGLLPSSDYGDAPQSYGTLAADGGASHGIVPGLFLGATVDREIDGAPFNAANGDDTRGADDEDGVILRSPLGQDDRSNFSVTVTNTTGSLAYLQGFMDFNGDGDFEDIVDGLPEQFLTDRVIGVGTTGETINVPVDVPASARIGDTFARFRLSNTQGLGATGFAGSGEVEDYAYTIREATEVAVDDPTPGDPASEADFTVSRNTNANLLDVLANDFDTADNPLTIESIDTTGLRGVVVVAADGKSISYTPPSGFVGLDQFRYRVIDSVGNRSDFATVSVTVSFRSTVPIAVDNSFEVPEGSVNRALNVLDNDVSSTSGGLTITSVGPGSNGGSITIIGGGQSLRYTPLPGFNGTEQFSYSIQDSANQVSEAQVTVNLLPGARNDDVVDYTVDVFDVTNGRPISNVRVGEEFFVRVSVEDLRNFANPEGVASAFLDLLYTDELVAVSTAGVQPGDPIDFDISFGPLFSGSENFLQRANADTPGLIDEVGGVQPIGDQQSHNGPTELFTIRMRAVSPGVAQFISDPADESVSDTVVLGSDNELTAAQLGLGRTELVILPSSDVFTAAIDDSFPDGRDSDGELISNNSIERNALRVLENDNLGITGVVREFGLVTNPTFGTIFIDDAGTPGDLNDDFFSYRANLGANGLERFTYEIVTDDNVRSTAEVTIPLGNVNTNALVDISFDLVNASGTSISSVNVGDTFGIQVNVEDVRSFPTAVFAGFVDVLYSSELIQPTDGALGSEFDFGVEFGNGFSADAGVGTAARPGIIDEFGTNSTFTELNNATNPALLATLFFTAVAPGTAEVIGSPADSSPFQDTLLFNLDDPVEIDQIRYDKFVFSVNVGAGEGESIQNPTMRQDVNNDGDVSAIDALLIINHVSRQASAEGEQGSQTNQYYTDVNGDRKTSAIDALQVINYLARNRSAQGESESVLPSTSAPTATDLSSDSAGASDAVFADLQSSGKVFSAGSADASGSQDSGLFVADDDDDSDSKTDVLDLLADDVSGLWS